MELDWSVAEHIDNRVKALAGLKSFSYTVPSMKRTMANGQGWIVYDYSKPPKHTEEQVDYIILLGNVPDKAIRWYLTGLRVGGIMAVEVSNRDAEDVRQLITFFKMLDQHAYSFFVDGVKYLFIVRLEV